MRSTIIFGTVSLLGLASGQPNRHRRHERLHQQHKLAKRQQAEVVETVFDYVTETTPSVTVYVDGSGNVLYSVAGQAAPTTATSAAAPPPVAVVSKTTTTPAPVAPAPKTTTTSVIPPPASSAPAAPVAPIVSSVAPVSPPAASPVIPVAPAPSAPASNGPYGIVALAYSPYKGHFGSTSCKSASDVAQDFGMIDSSKYNAVRIYGTDCNQVANVLAAAKPKGLKIFAGVYNVANYESEIGTMASAANGDWSSFHTVSIGNEAVSSGTAVGDVLNALDKGRALLKTKGFNGPVVAVDTFMAVQSNPDLCTKSDYIAVNMHPYWDYNTDSSDAGDFMTTQIKNVQAKCGGGQVVISETGWPSSGATKGKAVCSKSDQSAAIASITGALGHGYVLLGAFDDWWKNPGPDGVEQMFGLMGTAPSG